MMCGFAHILSGGQNHPNGRACDFAHILSGGHRMSMQTCVTLHTFSQSFLPVGRVTLHTFSCSIGGWRSQCDIAHILSGGQRPRYRLAEVACDYAHIILDGQRKNQKNDEVCDIAHIFCSN